MTMELKNYKVYRFCDGEIVDGLNRRHYNPQKEDDMQCICTILNAQIHELNKLQKENKNLDMTSTNALEALDVLNEDNKQYNILVESLKDENQRLKLRLKDLGVEF